MADSTAQDSLSAAAPAQVPVILAPGRARITPTQHMVAMIVVLGFFALIGLLAWHSVPAENKEALEIVLGTLASAFGAVIAFYFTSTGGTRAATPTPQQGAAP